MKKRLVLVFILIQGCITISLAQTTVSLSSSISTSPCILIATDEGTSAEAVSSAGLTLSRPMECSRVDLLTASKPDSFNQSKSVVVNKSVIRQEQGKKIHLFRQYQVTGIVIPDFQTETPKPAGTFSQSSLLFNISESY